MNIAQLKVSAANPTTNKKKPFTKTVPLCKHFDLQSIKPVNLNEQVATMVRDV
jgi:hypothetical protein